MEANQARTFRRVGHDAVGWEHPIRDPVCGMPVAQSVLRFTYEGRSFPFCSFRCASRFREDPERFLRATALADDECDGVIGD